MKGLTQRQQETLDFIEEFTEREGMAPTIYEIADQFGIKSATSFAHVRALQRKGYLTRSNKARSMALTSTTTRPRNLSFMLSIPLLGRISAGMPLMAEENVEREIQIDPSSFHGMRADGKLFALLVNGESMRDAGILDGDTIIVKLQENANIGDIVVAMVNGETTVKQLFMDNGRVELRPCNDEFQTQFYDPQEVYIQGKVVALQRVI
jgi:repressor LexA